jgi:ketosteroid isomerase-like protein
MSRKIVLEFINKINEHDVGGLAALMSEDHVFVDAWGAEVRGKHLMRNAWKEYFEWFPDYKLDVEEIFEKSGRFAVVGFASGTYRGIKSKENLWMLPAAWRAVVEEGRVKEWQVFCDTRKVFDVMERNK